MDSSCSSEPSNYTKEEIKELYDKVFGLELLRELILDYVTHGEEKVKAISNIRLCRLVCKDWLRSTSRILLQRQEPLFCFRFTNTDRMVWFPFTKSDNNIGETLGKFANTVSGASHLHDRVPPYAIKADSELLIWENRQSFYNFLVQCASGLVELKLQFNEKTAFVLNANIVFPKLRKFEVVVSAGRMENHIPFLQAIVNACQELKFLSVKSRTFDDMHSSIQAFLFPSSICELNLDNCVLDSKALANNLVPNLKVLKLGCIEVEQMDGLVNRILENVKKTLKVFDISFRWTRQGLEQRPINFRLPLMEKLKRLEIDGQHYQLKHKFSTLEQLVPVLTHLSLPYQTVSSFRQWTERSRFHSVQTLHVSLRSLEPNHHEYAPGVNFDLPTMEKVKAAFPNVRELRISIYDKDTSVYAFIMKEMTNLKILRICAMNSSPHQLGDIVPAEYWEVLLLGIPVESVIALRNSPELWETMQDESTASIRNMADLSTLEISCTYGTSNFELSSAVFRHAFFLMPNLTKLDFNNRFCVSEEMQQAWKGQGRFIEIAK